MSLNDFKRHSKSHFDLLFIGESDRRPFCVPMTFGKGSNTVPPNKSTDASARNIALGALTQRAKSTSSVRGRSQFLVSGLS